MTSWPLSPIRMPLCSRSPSGHMNGDEQPLFIMNCMRDGPFVSPPTCARRDGDGRPPGGESRLTESTTKQLGSPQPRAESQSWSVRSRRSFRDTRAPRPVWRARAGVLVLGTALAGGADVARADVLISNANRPRPRTASAALCVETSVLAKERGRRHSRRVPTMAGMRCHWWSSISRTPPRWPPRG